VHEGRQAPDAGRGRRLAHLRVREGVALIELWHPPANAYTFEMMHDLDEAVLTARLDDEVRALVLSGAGESFFCAGPDLDLLRSVTPGFRAAFQLHARETLERLAGTPKLVVAALNGHALGGGLELAMAADRRIARRGAGCLGPATAGLGVLPGPRWPAGPGIPAGALLSFEEARPLGLVDEVWEAASAEHFLEAVAAFARREASTGARASWGDRGAPGGEEVSFEAALARERERLERLLKA
jgi:enoyl-CoA hydratase/carnithine racemase